MVVFQFSSGDPLSLIAAPERSFRGIRIPGARLYRWAGGPYTTHVHVYQQKHYAISLRQFAFDQSGELVVEEDPKWLRMDILLEGSCRIFQKGDSGKEFTTGQYLLTDQGVYGLEPGAGKTACLTVHFSSELLDGIGGEKPIISGQPVFMPLAMSELVDGILSCPFQEHLREFYYSNKVRELLFLHLASQPVVLPLDLTREQVAQIHEADRIMAQNLDGRITIPQLARMLGTNFVTLKRNYEKVFGVGLFARLMQRKMDYSKQLLEQTDKPLKDIADLSGYQTLPGFINAFRKRFGMTPNAWRKMRKGK